MATYDITQRQRTDTAANWTSNNPTLASGEFGYESDTGKFKVGDGSTAWTGLGYYGASVHAAASHTHSASDLTSGTLGNARVTEANVTQHQAALTITESQISDLGAYLANVSEDATPQLGGSLDVNGNKIVSTANGNIDIEPNGTGNVLLGNFTFDADQTVGAGQDNYVLTYDNAAGTISLEAAGAGSGDMVAATYDPATISEQLVGLTATQTLTNKTLTSPAVNTPTLVLANAAGAAPTTDGEIKFDRTGENIEVGDGIATLSFSHDAGTATLTNKTVNLTSNTLTGTTAQFNTALSDGDFATLAGSETLTNKTVNLTSNTLTGTTAQFNTALSDGDFATLAGSETLTNKTIAGGTATATNTLRVRSDTAANWTSGNPTLAAGEWGFESDTGLLKIGDGATAWTTLTYSVMIQDGSFGNGDVSVFNSTSGQFEPATAASLTKSGNSTTLATTDGTHTSGSLTKWNANGNLTVGTVAFDDLSDVTITTAAQGQLLYYNGSAWVNLAVGVNGQFLKTQGAGANPTWDTIAGGGDMLASTYDPAAISQQLLGTTATQTVTNKTIAFGSNTLTDVMSLTTAQSVTAGIKKTFQADATNAGFRLAGVAANPSTPAAGDLWYRSDTNVVTYYDGSSPRPLVSTGGTQTLTNKTIALGSNTVSGTTAQFNTALTDGDFATLAGSETLTNKTLTSPTVNTPTLVLADANGAAPTTDGEIKFDRTGENLEVGDGAATLTFSHDAGTATLSNKTLVAPALGTPASGTLTNCTGLPLTGLVNDTTTAVGLGSINLGHASDTTIARVSAGVISVEGVTVPTVSSTDTLSNKTFVAPAIGTPASGTLTNCTGLPVAGITSSTSTALGVGSLEVGHASDTTIARVSAGVISVEGVTVPTISSTSTLTNKTIAGGSSSSATNTLSIRTDTAANWTSNNPTLGAGVWGHDSTTNRVKMGDGSTAWTSLPYLRHEHAIGIACSDETTALTTGTAKATFRMPYAFTLTGVRASVTTAPTGGTLLTVDINETGTTILSTKLTFDASEKTTTTAATPAVISDTSLADDAEITIDIDAVGSTVAGAGLKVWLIGYRT